MVARGFRRNAAFQTQMIKKKIAQLTLTVNSKATMLLSCLVKIFGWIRGITGEPPKSFQVSEMFERGCLSG